MHCNTCEEVVNSLGTDESAPSGLSGSSTSMGGGAPKAIDGNSLLGVLSQEMGIEVAERVHCSLSKAPCIWRLRVLAILGWGFDGGKRGGTRVVLIALGFMPQMSTSIIGGISGSFTNGSHIPEWQLFEVECQSMDPCAQSSWADHLLPAL